MTEEELAAIEARADALISRPVASEGIQQAYRDITGLCTALRAAWARLADWDREAQWGIKCAQCGTMTPRRTGICIICARGGHD